MQTSSSSASCVAWQAAVPERAFSRPLSRAGARGARQHCVCRDGARPRQRRRPAAQERQPLRAQEGRAVHDPPPAQGAGARRHVRAAHRHPADGQEPQRAADRRDARDGRRRGVARAHGQVRAPRPRARQDPAQAAAGGLCARVRRRRRHGPLPAGQDPLPAACAGPRQRRGIRGHEWRPSAGACRGRGVEERGDASAPAAAAAALQVATSTHPAPPHTHTPRSRPTQRRTRTRATPCSTSASTRSWPS